MDADYVSKSGSDYGWSRTFTGQVYDSETGFMLYRNRFYSMDLGRFVTRDPIGYAAGDVSLYRYVGNRSVVFQDSYGLQYPNYPINTNPPSGPAAWTVFDFIAWYFFGRGRGVTLAQTGLLQPYREKTYGYRKMLIIDDVQPKITATCDNPDQTITGTVKIKTFVGKDYSDPLYVLGGSEYPASYSCNVHLTCLCCNGSKKPIKQQVNCSVDFHFKDEFANPLDRVDMNYVRKECEYQNCLQDCYDKYWSITGALKLVSCIINCENKYPWSELPFATPYDITDEWNDSISWEKTLGTC